MTAWLLSAVTLDQTLTQWVAAYGSWALGLVALIVFAETGLVVAPFLPGDSLLFLTGTVLAAAALNVHVAVAALILAAVAGDALNFAVGRRTGQWIVGNSRGRLLKPSHLSATQAYFGRFGAWTIVVARFVPVVRTIAPFLAVAGRMRYARFAAFNVLGGVAWVASLVYGGAYLGSRPFVREHLSLITMSIVAVSVVPVGVATARAWLRRGGKTGSSSLAIAPLNTRQPPDI